MYDEAEYGDTLKSWAVPTYMLCAELSPTAFADLSNGHQEEKCRLFDRAKNLDRVNPSAAITVCTRF